MIILTPYDTIADLLSKIFSDINTASAALTVVFSMIALGVAIVISIRSSVSLAVKILGSLFVMAICFASNNAFVYAIGIFIVATLVTELEFLEKLAALAWNRKEYWDYLKGKATPKDIENKIQEELEAEQTPDQIEASSEKAALPPAPSDDLIKDAYEFNQKVLKSFRPSLSPLKIYRLETEALLLGEGRRYIIDGIAHSEKATYIIEVKSVRPRNLNDAIYQLRQYVDVYAKYADERGRSQSLRAILVLPDGAAERNWSKDIAVLKYDVKTGKFTNIEEVKRHFPEWDWR